MFRGLALLINHIFINAARHVKNVNSAGARKIRRNILSLQQTLRGIVPSSSDGMLARAMEYWDLFQQGPKGMLQNISRTRPQFSFEDYNAMLQLQCAAKEHGDADLNSHLIDLHALAMEVEGWE